MYRWKSGVAVAIVVLGVVGIGCGGGGETTSDVTKAQFTKKVNQICAEAKRERLAAAEKEFNPKQRQGPHSVGAADTKELEAELEKLGEELLTDKIIPSLKGQQEKLEAIGSPEGDADKVEAMMTNMEKAIVEIEKGGYQAIVGNQFDAFEKEAETYGLSCKVI